MAVGLYDVKTQKETYANEDEAAKGISEGWLSPAKGTTYNMVKADGTSTGVPGTDVHLALSNGWRFETPKETRINNYLEENKGLKGAAKAAGAAAVTEGSFGVLDPTRGDDELQALQQDHKVATAIGAGAGLAGSMLYGGEVFKTAQLAGKAAEGALLGERAAKAIGLGERITRAAVRTGVESAALATPRAVSEAVMGDPDEAAETLLWSLGTGAALGAAGSLFAAGAERTAGAAKQGFKSLTGEDLSGPNIGKLLQQRAVQAEEKIAAGESLSLSNVLFGKNSNDTLTNVLLATSHPVAYGAKVAKSLLTSEEMIAKYGNQLGLALTDGALETAAQRLAGVGTALRRGALAASNTVKPKDVFGDFLGSKVSNERDGFDRVSERITNLAASPLEMAESSAGKAISDGAPETAAAYAAASQRTLNYLSSQLPRPIAGFDPLSDQKWKPSKAQLSAYARKLAVVSNPMSVLHRLADGTLSVDEVNALDAVYPKVAARLRQELVMSLGDDKVRRSLSPAKRSKIRLLLGPGSGYAPQNVADFQATYANKNQGPQFNGRKVNVGKLPGSQPTTEQRLSAGM